MHDVFHGLQRHMSCVLCDEILMVRLWYTEDLQTFPIPLEVLVLYCTIDRGKELTLFLLLSKTHTHLSPLYGDKIN